MLRYFLLLLTICPLPALAQGPDSLWERLPVQFPSQVNDLYGDTTSGDLYISGYGGLVNGDTSCLVKWDGQQATLLHPPLGDGFGVFKYKNKLMLSGLGLTMPWPNKLLTYDGQSWKALDSSTGWYFAAIAELDGKLVITGDFESIAGHPIKMTALWDGDTSWSDLYQMDTCMPNTLGVYVVKYKGDIYAGGTIYGPRNITHIARFDGKNWVDVGGGIPAGGLGGVNSMLIWKNELYVAGEFLESQGAPGNSIAKWDGQKWHRLGNGINGGSLGGISDMAVYHDNLYVVGVFYEADGIPVHDIAKWDGSRWCSLNTDFGQGGPSQIEVAKGQLYVSGQLTTINGKTVSHVAYWTGGDYVYQCGPVRLGGDEISKADQSLLYPNPAVDMLFIKRTDIRSLTVYDATGKLVKTATTGEVKSGIDVSNWPAGFYFAKAIHRDGVMIHSTFVKQ